ncbi:MAG: hypothetical protein L6R40_004423 [Gallowayella cf. fulva]|nr:MAG: hypothetical protein L6R40_004423 [Xanthomendoza cf. fulva]
MALAPKFSGQAYTDVSPKTTHTLELCQSFLPSFPIPITPINIRTSPRLRLPRTLHPPKNPPPSPSLTLPQFSSKMFLTLSTSILPTLPRKPYLGKLRILFRQQIQPWHPSSTLCHEAAAAVLRLAPAAFYPFSHTLFEHQTEFFDVNVVNETRNQTYRRLAKLAGTVEGVEEERVYGLLEVGDQPGEDGGLNVGNGVTDDVKLMVKVRC